MNKGARLAIGGCDREGPQGAAISHEKRGLLAGGFSWERGRPSLKVERCNGTRSRIAVPECTFNVHVHLYIYIYIWTSRIPAPIRNFEVSWTLIALGLTRCVYLENLYSKKRSFTWIYCDFSLIPRTSRLYRQYIYILCL